MNNQPTLPKDRIRMPRTFAGSGALEYLSSDGLPPRCEWRYPLCGRYVDQHCVDFSALMDPRSMSDILVTQDAPEWLVSYHNWRAFLAIGTWQTIGPTGFTMKWNICSNMYNGRMLRVESQLNSLRLSLKSNEEMAAHIEAEHIEDGAPAIEPIRLARLECVVFVNSSPQQLMQCFELYFAFVNREIVFAEKFLESISRVDPPACEHGTLWHLLVGNYLRQDEY